MRKIIVGFVFIFTLSFSAVAQTKISQKTYEFTNVEDCEIAKAQLDNLTLKLKKQPNAVIYIVYYGGRNYSIYNRKKDKQMIQLPRLNEAKDRVNEFIDIYMVREHFGGKVKVINGGFRENYTVQFWLVPEGVEPPEITSTVNSKDIKFRRGKYKNRKGEGC